MSVQLYNSLTRAKEVFTPVHSEEVGVYTCGPTVYGVASIGNLRSMIFADLLVRVLRHAGYRVRWIMNITDVGHLVTDADEGEDKMEVGSKREGKTAWDIAREYTDQFLLDLDRLHVVRPDHLPRATDHIAEQVEMIRVLEEKGFAYRTDDGMYFDTSKVADYGRLSGQRVEEKEEGARVGVNVQKRNASDFAVWKFSPKDEQRQMEWESPWGVGFPGWHIECTAMSQKYLGALYDIHTGGEDLKMVHHPNEMAQAQGATGTDEARVWMHGAFLMVDGGKMSKSLGNAYTLDDVLAHGFDALAFRYLTLTAGYRHPLNFTWDSLAASASALKRLFETARGLDAPTTPAPDYYQRFVEAVQDDLDYPKAVAILWDLLNDAGVSGGAKAQTLLSWEPLLGLGLNDVVAKPIVVPEEVERLLERRQVARDEKNWAMADQLRDEIAQAGYVVEDTPDGQKVSLH